MNNPEVDYREVLFRALWAFAYNEGVWFEKDWGLTDEQLDQIKREYDEWEMTSPWFASHQRLNEAVTIQQWPEDDRKR